MYILYKKFVIYKLLLFWGINDYMYNSKVLSNRRTIKYHCALKTTKVYFYNKEVTTLFINSDVVDQDLT